MGVEDRGAEGRGTQAPYLKTLNGIYIAIAQWKNVLLLKN